MELIVLIFILLVSLLPLKRLGIESICRLYGGFLITALIQLSLILPLGILVLLKMIPVTISSLLIISIIAPITEEIYKFWALWGVRKARPYLYVGWVVAGFETIVYFLGTWLKAANQSVGLTQNDYSIFIIKRSPTILLHMGTSFLIWYFYVKLKRPRTGIAIAMVIHGIFNYYVVHN